MAPGRTSAWFHPQARSHCPNLAHRTSAPYLFHAPHNAQTQHLSAHSVHMLTFPPPPSHRPAPYPLEKRDVFAPRQQQDTFSRIYPDPFSAVSSPVALAPDEGCLFGMPPPAAVAASSVIPASDIYNGRSPQASSLALQEPRLHRRCILWLQLWLSGLDYLRYPHTEAFGVPSIHST